MDDAFLERLSTEVRSWVADGLITRSQAQRILERYEIDKPVDGHVDTSWVGSVLYATAAVLLGSAAIALVLVGLDPVNPETWLFGIGLLVAAAGGVVHALVDERPLLGDALLAAGLAPLAAAVIIEPEAPTALAYAGASSALGLIYLVTRHKASFLPTLTVVGVSVVMAAAAFTGTWFPTEAGALGWMVGQLALLGLVFALDRFRRAHPHAAPTVVAVGAWAVSLFPFFFETVGLEQLESVQLWVGGLMVVVMAAGVFVADRGLAAGSGASLSVIAIFFAFTVGGWLLGSGLLVALAAGIIWQAERLQDWLSRA